jgi:hypothetical protein
MKIKLFITVLLVVILTGGCLQHNIQTENEVRPGVYMSNDPAEFSYPTSGYRVYFVGESHGNRETKLVFREYLKKLYEDAGLRDVILEEDQSYESDANAYVHGQVDQLAEGLCLRNDILNHIREFNASLPENQQVVVHLVDVDSPFPIIHKHLMELKDQIGSDADAIQVPRSSDLRNWNSQQRADLIMELQDIAANRPEILNGLDTVSLSLDWFFLGNRMDTRMPAAAGGQAFFAPIREDVITKNIEFLLNQLKDKPVLAFFGANHGMKTQGFAELPIEGFETWVERLTLSGVPVYSVTINALAGEGYWRGDTFTYEAPGEQQYEGVDGYRFGDGTTLVSLFETHPDRQILFVDLATEDNTDVQLPKSYLDIPASQLYDGLILFKEFTPMENACQ